MSETNSMRPLFDVFQSFMRHPWVSFRLLQELPAAVRGHVRAQEWNGSRTMTGTPSPVPPDNPLRAYFDAHETGRGIWKWEHYFDIYHRHFSKFIGREVHVLEIGIYSGGSLRMWRDYFGPQCRVYGVDIQEACRTYEDEHTRIFIGDQADRQFWARVRTEVPRLDILIDDGGHLPEQQIVTLEEMLPHLRPGGVFLCEDVHGFFNGFSAYAQGLADNLHAYATPPDQAGDRRKLVSNSTRFQRAIRSIHTYPFATVIERADEPVKQFVCPKHGTEWQPFL